MEYTDIELKNEQWRDVEGYDGVYQVSDLGRVRSRKSGEWKMLRPGKDMDGYLMVVLCKDGKTSTRKVHRLVAQAFIPNDDETKTIINHRNSIRDCNRVDNLEWCDYQYNNTYNDIHRRRKQYIHTQPVRGKLKELYDPNLSIDDNIEVFRANGIGCCAKTVQRLRKDLGITKHYKQRNLKRINVPNQREWRLNRF